MPAGPQPPSESLVVRADRVLAERVHGETLVLDLATDRCTRLNASGSVLWEELESPRTVRALAERLQREFALDSTRAQADVEAFVRELTGRRLVELRPA